MKIKNLIKELESQEDPRFKSVANNMSKMTDRFIAGEISAEDFEIKITALANLLKIYGIKKKVRYKVAAQMVEDLLEFIALKGVTSIASIF
jgi:hypothetical protein